MGKRICDILGTLGEFWTSSMPNAPGIFFMVVRHVWSAGRFRQKERIHMKNQLSEEIRNPELIEAMAAVNRHNTEKTRGHMAAVLMNSRLLSPIQKQTVLTEKEGPSTRIKFEDIQNVEGDKYYLAFTDMDEYAKWNKDGKHDHALIMTMEDFGNILIRNINDLRGFVINPYGENISITKDLLLSLLKQREAKQNASRGN